MTIEQMAEQLGVSKSTVSRALSGKGRIGKETRERVLALAGSEERKKKKVPEKTGNIAVVMPTDAYRTGGEYFHECLIGICEEASARDYDIMITDVTGNDYSGVDRLIRKKKIDGVILTRTMEHDRTIQNLAAMQFPVAVTGSVDNDFVIQVDVDNERASEDLTTYLISRGYRRFAIVLDYMEYAVNRNRYDGFCRALYQKGIPYEWSPLEFGITKYGIIQNLVRELMAKRIDCVVCGDDIICTSLLSAFLAEGYRIPRDIGIASLYNSSNLSCFSPAVTTVNVKTRRVGRMVCNQLLNALTGKEYQKKSYVDYELLVRKSMDRIDMEQENESL